MGSDLDAAAVLRRIPPDERRAVERFRDAVRERFGERVRDLRLYGSKVREDWDDESDVDILVLVDDLDARTREAILDLAIAVDIRLSPMVLEFDGYHAPVSRATGFYNEIRERSVRL